MTCYTKFSEIPLFKYGLIVADPPWNFALRSQKGEKKSAQAQYGCMLSDELTSMRVADLAYGDCLLWLWATNPMLPQALDLMAAWGFTFKTAGHWSKKTASRRSAQATCCAVQASPS